MQFIMSNLPGDIIVTHSNGKHELQSDCRLLPLVACWPDSPTVSLVAPPTSLDALVPPP
jgi:hypothetical protein